MTIPGSDAGVFLVDDDIFSAQEAHRLTADEEKAAIQARPMDEILYIGSVVARNGPLPVDVVNSVLEFAGVLLAFQTETTEHRRGRSDMNEDYLVLQIPTAEELAIPVGVSVSKCALVVADCVSKDQGWATDGREHNGTYRSSSSWNEIAVKEVTGEGEMHEVTRVPFCPNLRASRNFRHHRKYFSGSSGLLEHVKLGTAVSIVLRSRYPGWTNTARFGRLGVCFAVEFNDEFSFADIPEPASLTSSVPEEAAGAGSAIPCCLQ